MQISYNLGACTLMHTCLVGDQIIFIIKIFETHVFTRYDAHIQTNLSLSLWFTVNQNNIGPPKMQKNMVLSNY